MKAAVAAFFELPLEEKRNYAMAANDIHGYGQGYVVSEHQKLDWCDLMFLVTSPPKIPENEILAGYDTRFQVCTSALFQYRRRHNYTAYVTY
jgi:isopenicillin N synthase-like dioxygenase